MYRSEGANSHGAERTVHLAAAVVAIGVPIVSAGFLLTPLVAPDLIGFHDFTSLVMPATLGLNSANVLLFLGLSRGRLGPDWLRNVWSIGAVFSGVCVSTAIVVGAFIGILGG